MKSSTQDLATRAQLARSSVPFEKRTFLKFTAPGLNGQDVTLVFEASSYKCGAPLHLQLWSNDHEEPCFWSPYVTLTKSAEPSGCQDGEIVVKTSDENAHLRDVLLTRGFFEDTGRRLRAGYSVLEIWTMTDLFTAALEEVLGAQKPAKKTKAKAAVLT